MIAEVFIDNRVGTPGRDENLTVSDVIHRILKEFNDNFGSIYTYFKLDRPDGSMIMFPDYSFSYTDGVLIFNTNVKEYEYFSKCKAYFVNMKRDEKNTRKIDFAIVAEEA